MHCRRRRTSEGQDEADSTVLSNRGVPKASWKRFSECEPTNRAVLLRPEASGSNGGLSGRVAPAQQIGRPRFERRNCWTGAGANDTLRKPATAGGTFGSKWRPVLIEATRVFRSRGRINAQSRSEATAQAGSYLSRSRHHEPGRARVFLEIADDMESHADRMEGKSPANDRRPSS